MTAMLLGLGLSGCQRSEEAIWPISGTVTFQGKPISAGMIRFGNPTRGIDMTAAVQSDGAYTVVTARGAGLPEGTYRVAVVPPAIRIPLGPIKQPLEPQSYPDIPPKFREFQTSGLTLTVKRGENRFDVAM